MSFRIVAYTAALHGHDFDQTIVALLEKYPTLEILALEHRPHKPLKLLIRNQFRNIRRHGWRWIPYQLSEIVERLSARGKGRSSFPVSDRLRVETVGSINSPEAVDLVRRWKPDLGLSLAAPIIRERQFGLPRLGTLNIHKGRLPEYRGMPPAFWELWNRESEVGITVHRVEAGLDTGDILLQRTLPIARYSTPAGLRVRLNKIGVEMIVEAVGLMMNGTARFMPQTGEGRTFSRPTLRQEKQLRDRTAGFDPKRAIKNRIFSGYHLLGRCSSSYADRTVIFLYHRVNDVHRDDVTIGVEQFERHIRYLADHHRMVRVEDLIEDAPTGRGPAVAVSFDDGYLDNYENAAPILIKHGVPATFFVSTDNIAHDHGFEHDIRKLGGGLPNMTWDQIREMHEAGLDFGSHTANHINLAQSPAHIVETELRRSREALQAELGLKRVMFAHPFGKRSDIAPDRLQQIKDAGYSCNCSAYGGVNGRTVDRWDIRRQGINHAFDIAALKAKIAGWKSTDYV